MPTYNYKATDAAGKSVNGLMEAKNDSAIISRLQELGYFPVDIARQGDTVKQGGPVTFGIFSRRVSGAAVAEFTHELSSMLDAGLPLDRSLSILAGLEKNPVFRDLLLDINRGIHGGDTLADCLARHPAVFSDIYINTVKAGEAGGALEGVLDRLGKFLEETERLKDDIRSALLYPLLLTAAGGAALVVMLLFVIPRFSVIFEDLGGVMPLPTRMLLWTSNNLLAWWWVPPAIAGAAYALLFRRLKTEGGRIFLDRLKLRVPLLGPVFTKAVVSRFSRTLGTLMQSGLPILDSLKIAVNTMGNAAMAAEIQPVIEGVRRGRGVAEPLKEISSFPPLAVHMLIVGEETGRLDEMLLRLADNYDRQITISIKRLLSLLEPTIILLMAIIVGFMVISLLLAVFSLNDLPI